MATVKLQGNASGSGSVTLVAPNTNSTRTVTLPDADVTLGGAGSIEAWVNFNGSGTVSIRDDGNVSSITDNGTGSYGVNFSSSLSNADYCANVTGKGNQSTGGHYIVHLFQTTVSNSTNPTTSGYVFIGVNWNNGQSDVDYVCASTVAA